MLVMNLKVYRKTHKKVNIYIDLDKSKHHRLHVYKQINSPHLKNSKT